MEAVTKSGDLKLMKWLRMHQDRYSVKCTSGCSRFRRTCSSSAGRSAASEGRDQLKVVAAARLSTNRLAKNSWSVHWHSVLTYQNTRTWASVTSTEAAASCSSGSKSTQSRRLDLCSTHHFDCPQLSMGIWRWSRDCLAKGSDAIVRR